jgi:hypothetical protein
MHNSGETRREIAKAYLKLGRRHCERSEAIHLAAQRKNGLLRCARNDGAGGKHTFTPSRRDAPGALLEFSAQRGRGERRMPVAPASGAQLPPLAQ